MQTTRLRESGLQCAHHLPWGSHFCQFYYTREDLVDTLVPYFTAGLRNNESCLWITSEPLQAEEAKDRMLAAMPDFKSYLAKGQIEIKDLRDWYVPGRRFDADDVLQAWLERVARAERGGYDGLRLTGNTFWLQRSCWNDFMAYEHKVNAAFSRQRILALCTYSMERCNAQDVVDVVRTHQFALARRDGQWEMIESASLKVAKEALQRVNEELEQRVAERTRALQAALNARDEFLAMLAHELRNPLAPIRSAAQVVRLTAPADRNIAAASEVLDRQVVHLSRLVDDLLEGARITRGIVTLKKEVVSVASIITRAVESIQPTIAARRHALTVSLPAEPLHVDADPVRAVQVLGNLLDNAAKYTPEGGTLALSAERQGEQAVIRVRDDGVGIPADMLAHVFDLFTQLERGADRAKGGLGLGLSVVRRLVEMHGGSVEARSAGPGTGSEFIVRLPACAPDARSVDAPIDGQRDRARNGRRVLVVDDNMDSADTMAMTLRLLGHESCTAYSGDEALKAAQRFLPDAVLLDLGLPGMDGHEVARRLRAAPGMQAARLIALTGYSHEEHRRRGREAGFDDYQVKPVSPEKLGSLLAPSGFAAQGRAQS